MLFARLLILFVTVPVIEMILFYQIGTRIGLSATLATIVLTGIAGAWLARTQGVAALARFQRALAEGRMPHEEVLDGIMILVAGAVLLTPGFLTDAAGFLLLVPPARAAVRRALARYVKARVQIMQAPVSGPGEDAASPPRQNDKESPSPRRGPVVIDAEIIDD